MASATDAAVLSGMIVLWFMLTILAVAFVAIDIRSTPESPVLKWAFVLITAYTGPLGAFFYVLGCREPLPGLHSRYVAVRWRQVLGSTMHCVAGDGLGILAGAAVGGILRLSPPAHITLEYIVGFGLGWSIFQALFMRDTAGGSFTRALKLTFIPEFLSMNLLMAGMLPVMTIMMAYIPGSEAPQHPTFWFVMSIALLAGAILAYPMNWWLVVHHLKHGMMTARRLATVTFASEAMPDMEQMKSRESHPMKPATAAIVKMAILSVAVFAGGVLASVLLR